MESEFLLWKAGQPEPGVCLIKMVSNVPDEFELGRGVSRLQGWPDDATCDMDPLTRKDIALADGLFGSGRIVVSPKVQAVLAAEAVNHVELLPVRIVNHKGRVSAADYAIVNPLDVVDCIDQAKSGVEWNPVDPDSILGCHQLWLFEDKVPRDHQVFRLEGWRTVVVVRRSLAEKLKKGATGLRFTNPIEYNGT